MSSSPACQSVPDGEARLTWLVLCLLLPALAGGCAQAERRPALPPSPPLVDLRLSEYRIEDSQRRRPIPAGRVVFRAANRGQTNHQVLLVRIPKDVPDLTAQLRSPQRRQVEAIEYLPDLEPGSSSVFASDLFAGRYGLICFLTAPDGASHAVKGMSAELVVGKLPA